MITVIQNAYLKKAEMHPNFCETHKRILFVLTHEKKYYAKDELFCLANYNEKELDKAIKDLEETGTIISEGWLVRLKDFEEFNKEICSEINSFTVE